VSTVRALAMLTLSLGLIQPTLAARELSDDELRMKERLVALSQGNGEVADLRVGLLDGNMGAHRSYLIADGKIVKRAWEAPGAPEQHDERAVTDEAVRALLRGLVAKQYWTFQGTRFVPDNTVFLFRFDYKDLSQVDYRCDVDEYESSVERSAIRSTLLTFVSDSEPVEQPGAP
jgi:hypothetical protein